MFILTQLLNCITIPQPQCIRQQIFAKHLLLPKHQEKKLHMILKGFQHSQGDPITPAGALRQHCWVGFHGVTWTGALLRDGQGAVYGGREGKAPRGPRSPHCSDHSVGGLLGFSQRYSITRSEFSQADGEPKLC